MADQTALLHVAAASVRRLQHYCCFPGRGSLPEFQRLCFPLAYRGRGGPKSYRTLFAPYRVELGTEFLYDCRDAAILALVFING